jgi:hypothetical protein
MTGTPEAPGTAQEPPKKRSKIFRWRAIVPLVLLVILLVVGWILLLDTLVERGVEKAATAIVGAKVDVEEADVQLDEGAVVLRGLQVTNPDQPMKNLFEAREIVANLRVGPLLEKKVVVETLAVRDVRFGTDRTESGAIDNWTRGGERGRDLAGQPRHVGARARRRGARGLHADYVGAADPGARSPAADRFCAGAGGAVAERQPRPARDPGRDAARDHVAVDA